MANSPRKNAIERRIDELAGLWNEFASNPQPRMLRWLTDADGAQLVEVFLEVQNEEVGDVPDLFIRFDTPFEDPRRHGLALLALLREKYEEIREGIAAEGIASEWTCPTPRPGESDIAALAKACASLRTYYEAIMENLVLVLMPQAVADVAGWQEWLRKLVRSGLPANVRVMVLDDEEAPILDTVCKAEPERIVTVTPDLDMPGAMEELARSGGTGPGVSFRRHFVALSNAAAAGDLAKAARSGAAALSIASEHHWPQMQVVIHMALGGAYLGVGKLVEALASYRTAGKVAGDATAEGDPLGPKLRVQSLLADGSALVSGGQHAEAAVVYETAAPLATQQGDHLMAMESCRMAAYCHEMNGQFELAWRCGQLALEAGGSLDDQLRTNSTLQYVGQGLLRLTKHRAYARMADDVRERMAELIGPDWEQKVATRSA